MKTLLVVLLCLVSISAEARGRRYRRSINPDRAEEILAGIAIHQPLYDDEWLNILGTERRNQTYTIGKGDNLWGISRRMVAEPFYWRKLWQMNPFITNPHELEVGQILSLYQQRSDEAGAIRIPLLKLMPGGGFNDLDNDSVVNVDIKNKFLPKMIVINDDAVIGEISGGYTEKESFFHEDEFYIYFYERENIKVGDVYSVIRYERSLADGTQPGAPTIGNLAKLQGEIKVMGVGEELLRAEVKNMYGPIRRGDKIIPLEKPIQKSAQQKPPDDLEARVVMGEETERRSFVQGDMVLLNKGSSDGMRLGFFFRVFRDQDPFTRRRRDVEASFKGEVEIVYAGELSSIGYVTRNTDPIFIGDTLVAGQLFADPVRITNKGRDHIEIE